MAVGVLADRALALAAPPRARAAASCPVAPWRRGYHLAGDPLLAQHTRDALTRGRPPARPSRPGRGAARRRPARHARRRVDLARPAPGRAPSWRWWVGHWARRDELPPRLDLAAVAATLGRAGSGADRVHLVVGTPLPATLLGAAPGPRPEPLSADAGELVTRVNEVLPGAGRPRAAPAAARPGRAAAAGRRARRATRRTRAPAGVGARPGRTPRRGAVGGLDTLCTATWPPCCRARGEEPAATTAAGVLDVALRALLRTRQRGDRHRAGAKEVER